MAEEVMMDGMITLDRKLDGHGRILLPGDLRAAFGWNPYEDVEIRLGKVNGGELAFVITKKKKEED